MEIDSATSLAELLAVDNIGCDDHAQIRAEVPSRAQGREELELLAGQTLEPVPAAIVRDLLGDRPGALALLARDAANPRAAVLRGTLLLEAGKSAAARKILEKTYQTAPSTPWVGEYLVEARTFCGDTDGARELLGTLGLADDTPISNYLRAIIAERDGDYADALELYTVAADARPGESRFQFRLGYLHALHGDEGKAIKAYEMCQRHPPVFARALMNLGILYEDAERYEDACTCYRMVLQAIPDHERAQLYLIDAEASLDMYYDREKEKERSRRNQLLQLPVTDFELSVRSRNCLAKMNIHTLGDLMHKTEVELLSYKSFGETSLAEIKRILHQKGLRLGSGLDESRRDPALPDGEESKALAEPVSVLELASRSQRCMDRLGIESLADLCKHSELNLISQKNFGVTSLNEVKRKLGERGLGLASG